MSEIIKIIQSGSSKELFEKLRDVQNDKNVRVVILEFADETNFGSFDGFDKSVVSQIHFSTVPIITKIKQQAKGRLFEVLLASHICITTDLAIFEVSRKDLFELFTGTIKHEKLNLFENNFDVETALDLGIVNRAVKAEKLDKEAFEMAESIAKLAPLSIKANLMAINAGLEMDLDVALDLESELFSQIFSTRDMREGTSAFLEKRSPNFIGK